MKKQFPRMMMIAAALLLMLLFIFPLWKITLVAPQYPDGVAMQIWINKIGGKEPAVLQNINILNHYVGMKYIEPDSIPELVYFPFIVIGLATAALLAAFINNKYVFLAWGIIAVALAIAGIYDFYLWEYDYGHNLSPTAPIKVPGAVYQPPVFGTRKILSFTAHSYPDIGGIMSGVALLLSFVAFWLKGKKKKNEVAISVSARGDTALRMRSRA
jgi:copper chaperone NosL